MKSMSSSNSMIRRNIMLPSLDAQSDLSLIIVEKTSKQIKEIEKRTQEEIDIIQKEANKKIEEEIQKIQEKTSRKITLLTTQSKDIIKDISEDAINKIRHEIINEKAKFLMMRNKIESNGRTIIKLASHIKMLKNKKNHSMIKTQADIKNLCINKEKNKSRFEYRRMNHCSTILTPKHSEGDKIKIKSFADFIASEKNNSIKSL